MPNLLKLPLILVAWLFAAPEIIAQKFEKYVQTRNAMGTTVGITCYAQDSAKVSHVLDQAFYLIDSFNRIFSDYDPQSENLRITASKPGTKIGISDPLADLLRKSMEIYEQTNGLFNVQMGALTHLWRSHLKQNKIPSRCKVRRNLKNAAPHLVRLNKDDTIFFRRKNIRFDFGGIAKGYIGDHIAKLLRSEQIHRFMIDLGGDLVLGDAPPMQEGWKIDVTWCDKIVAVHNCAIATSGPDYQFFVHKGKRYAHIIDPATGWGVTHFFGSTVVAPSGWQADAYASALSIMTKNEIDKFLENINTISAIIGRNNELFHSDNFFDYVIQ